MILAASVRWCLTFAPSFTPIVGAPVGAPEPATGRFDAQEKRDGAAKEESPRPWVVHAEHIYTAAGRSIDNGAVLVNNGKISSVTVSHEEGAANEKLKVFAVIHGLLDAKVHHDRFVVTVVGRETSITAPVGQILSQKPHPGRKLKQGSKVSVVVSSGLPAVPIPSLTAVTGDCPAVTALLTTSHFKTVCTDPNSTTVAKGTVIDWNPKGSAPYGSAITVTVSAGPPVEVIPSLTGQSCTGATTTLQAVGLLANCTNQYSSTVASGQVISWTPTGSALQGSTVNIVISQGPQPVTIPANLYQMTVSEAIGALQALGLVPVSGGGALTGHVFLSNPPAGQSVLPGTTVTLYSR
jgi:beta-lactam-binding protein with PASTA domain